MTFTSEKRIKYLFNLFKFFGVAPMSFKVSKTQSKIYSSQPFNYSTYGIYYNVCLMIFIAATSYYSIYFCAWSHYKVRLKSEVIVDTVLTIFTIFSALLVLVVFCVRQRDAISIGNELSTISAKSKTLDIEKTTSSSIHFILSTHLVFLFLVLCFTYSEDDELFKYYISVSTCNFVCNGAIMQYSIILVHLKKFFKVINYNLAKILDVPDILLFEINNQRTKSCDSSRRMQKLLEFRNFYLRVFKFTGNLSDFYSLLMLVCIPNCFFTIMLYSYYVIRPLVIGMVFYKPKQIIRGSLQIVHSAISLVILTMSATGTQQESKRSGVIINEYSERIQNHQVVDQLKRFSDLLTHSNIRFTVYHLFDLDNSLLISIAGSLTTYLIILLQVNENMQMESEN